MTKVLIKANDSLICHCTCEIAYATNGQLECPWCGCGWLFTCTTCHKAFTLARVIETGDAPEDERIYKGADLELFETGEIAIYLDGMLLGPDDTDIDFQGYYANHVMKALPHATAKTKSDLDTIFGDRDYWISRARPSG